MHVRVCVCVGGGGGAGCWQRCRAGWRGGGRGACVGGPILPFGKTMCLPHKRVLSGRLLLNPPLCPTHVTHLSRQVMSPQRGRSPGGRHGPARAVRIPVFITLSTSLFLPLHLLALACPLALLLIPLDPVFQLRAAGRADGSIMIGLGASLWAAWHGN